MLRLPSTNLGEFGRMQHATDVQYFVLPGAASPYLLARVRWPDIAQAISPGRPEWQGDVGLFDLPYAPASRSVTPSEAETIAAQWGAELPHRDHEPVRGPTFFRRMPATWLHPSPAEMRAWFIEGLVGEQRSEVDKRERRKAGPSSPGSPTSRRRGVGLLGHRFRRRTETKAGPAVAMAEESPAARDVHADIEQMIINLREQAENMIDEAEGASTGAVPGDEDGGRVPLGQVGGGAGASAPGAPGAP